MNKDVFIELFSCSLVDFVLLTSDICTWPGQFVERFLLNHNCRGDVLFIIKGNQTGDHKLTRFKEKRRLDGFQTVTECQQKKLI